MTRPLEPAMNSAERPNEEPAIGDLARRLASVETELRHARRSPTDAVRRPLRAGLRVLPLAAVAVVFTAGYLAGARSAAWAEAGTTAQTHPQAAAVPRSDWADRIGAKADAIGQDADQHFDRYMSDLKLTLGRDKTQADDSGNVIAVTLHEMQKMLSAVPRMADDVHRMADGMQSMDRKMSAVPAMAAELNHLNRQMSVIVHDLDSTMGRMGRVMPWVP